GLVQLLAVVADALRVLAPRLDPLHGTTEAECRHGYQHLVRVHLALGTERAADVGNDHAHALGGQTEHARDHVALAVRTLDRRPHGQHTGLGVVVGEDAAALDRHRGQTRVAEALAHHGETRLRQIRLADGAPRIARAALASTRVMRAWACALRTTPRCTRSRRVRSST